MNDIFKVLKSDVHHTTTHAVGGGEWSIEVHNSDGTVIEEFVGSNGTCSPADDLWSAYEEWYANLPA